MERFLGRAADGSRPPGNEYGPAPEAGGDPPSVGDYHSAGCQVKTDGARIEVTFPGVDAGIFSGSLQYTVYRGTNLLRQEAIAKTNEPSVAYKYVAGLKGFPISDNTRVVWRDTARGVAAICLWRRGESGLGGPAGAQPPGDSGSERRLAGIPAALAQVFLLARNRNQPRLRVLPQGRRERPSPIGVRQPDREVGYKPYGISDEVWNRRVGESRGAPE